MAELVLDHDYDEQTYLKTIQEDFTQRAPSYDLGANGDMHIDLVENLLRFAPFQSPVLDIACGTGLLSSRVAAQGASVTGIDLTPAMLEVARKSCPTGSFLNGRAEQLPLPDCSFGCAYICAALVYFTDIPKALQEACRVIKPGGFLAYQAVSRDSYIIGNVLQEACERAFGKEEAKRVFQVPNKVTDTELDNRRLLEQAGFSDVQVTSVTKHSTLTVQHVEEFWPRVVGRNGLLGRVRLLDEDAMEKVRNLFIERIEQIRDVNGLVSEKVCSWYVMGKKE